MQNSKKYYTIAGGQVTMLVAPRAFIKNKYWRSARSGKASCIYNKFAFAIIIYVSGGRGDAASYNRNIVYLIPNPIGITDHGYFFCCG